MTHGHTANAGQGGTPTAAIPVPGCRVTRCCAVEPAAPPPTVRFQISGIFPHYTGGMNASFTRADRATRCAEAAAFRWPDGSQGPGRHTGALGDCGRPQGGGQQGAPGRPAAGCPEKPPPTPTPPTDTFLTATAHTAACTQWLGPPRHLAGRPVRSTQRRSRPRAARNVLPALSREARGGRGSRPSHPSNPSHSQRPGRGRGGALGRCSTTWPGSTSKIYPPAGVGHPPTYFW